MLPYRFRHFRRALIYPDLWFRRHPGPGDRLPSFALRTTDGVVVRDSDVRGRKLFITLGSITCPMTASSGPELKRCFEAYGDRVTFMTLYVREAHPGERFPQPQTFAEKLAHARAYKERDQIPWTVAVDDVDGTLHRALDPKPNSAYFVDEHGRIVFRLLWSNDAAGVRRGFEVLLSDNPFGRRSEREARIVPMTDGMGALEDVLPQSGPSAQRDFLRALPVAYAFGKLAGLFRPLRPMARSAAAAATIAAAIAAAVLVRFARRRQTA